MFCKYEIETIVLPVTASVSYLFLAINRIRALIENVLCLAASNGLRFFQATKYVNLAVTMLSLYQVQECSLDKVLTWLVTKVGKKCEKDKSWDLC